MNNAINYTGFIDMLINSDDEYEAYGFAQFARATVPIAGQSSHIMTQPLNDSEEADTWYGE